MTYTYIKTQLLWTVKAAVTANSRNPAMSRRDDLPFSQCFMRLVLVKRRDAYSRVSAFVCEIDELVYDLYGLTPEEIKIVEGEGS